jgi:hypothetical protein
VLDQDAERTSSVPVSGKTQSRRSPSRAPAGGLRKGLVAGVDALDSLGTLSLGPGSNQTPPKQRPTDNGVDDRTVVAHSGGVIAPSEAESELLTPRETEKCEPVAGVPPEAAGRRPSVPDSGVNPLGLPEASSQGLTTNSHAYSARKAARPGLRKARLALQWSLAGMTALAAAWYVLWQPAPQQPIERHWVSGRVR